MGGKGGQISGARASETATEDLNTRARVLLIFHKRAEKGPKEANCGYKGTATNTNGR